MRHSPFWDRYFNKIKNILSSHDAAWNMCTRPSSCPNSQPLCTNHKWQTHRGLRFKLAAFEPAFRSFSLPFFLMTRRSWSSRLRTMALYTANWQADLSLSALTCIRTMIYLMYDSGQPIDSQSFFTCLRRSCLAMSCKYRTCRLAARSEVFGALDELNAWLAWHANVSESTESIATKAT